MEIEIGNSNNIEIDLGNGNIDLNAGTQTYTNDTFHNNLKNLDYENSGHTGFQPEMDALTNMEIEELINNQS